MLSPAAFVWRTRTVSAAVRGITAIGIIAIGITANNAPSVARIILNLPWSGRAPTQPGSATPDRSASSSAFHPHGRGHRNDKLLPHVEVLARLLFVPAADAWRERLQERIAVPVAGGAARVAQPFLEKDGLHSLF